MCWAGWGGTGWLWGELPAVPGDWDWERDWDWELPQPAGLQCDGKALSPSTATGHWEMGDLSQTGGAEIQPQH